jgi:nuclear cap-binding protein subunit 1
VDAIFARLDDMDAECVDRFASWFAMHLSNTDYKWSWVDWDFVLQQDADSPKRRLVAEILEKTMRLAYYEVL